MAVDAFVQHLAAAASIPRCGVPATAELQGVQLAASHRVV
jgi:hypothetical protein